jgi:DNA polymerase III subunit chi
MSELLFYHLERQTLEQVLPALLEKTLERGWKAVVQVTSEARLATLDAHLWTYRDEAFLPHAAKGDARFANNAAEQPIWLTDEAETPNAANVLFLVEGASRPELDNFQRCVFLFDGRDEESLAHARQQWAGLKDSPHELTYWQQGEDGNWEQKA